MTPNEKLLRKALEAIQDGAKSQGAHTGMAWGQALRIASEAIAATEHPVTSALVAIFEGYVDGKPRIAWNGEPLPAGAELYAAPVAEQPARQDEAYAELRVRARARRVLAMDMQIAPDVVEDLLNDRDRLAERVAVLEEVIRMVRQYPDFDGESNAFSVMMDEALAGKRPTLIDTVDALAAGRMPAPHPHADEAAKVGLAEYREKTRIAIVDLFQRMEKSYAAEPTRRISMMDLDAVFHHVKELGLGGCLDRATPPSPAEGEPDHA